MKSMPIFDGDVNLAAASLRTLVSQVGDWYWECDAGFRLRLVRASNGERQDGPFAAWIGRTDWELPGRLLEPATWEAHRERLASHLPFANLVVERPSPGREGPGTFQLSGAPVFDAEGGFLGYVGIGRDLTEHFRTRAALERMASVDPLTGLLNRKSFDAAAGRALADAFARGEECVLLAIGIDRFDQVSSLYGHRVGDRMLAAVAERVQACLAPPTVLGRRDGAELLALLPDRGDTDDLSGLVQSLMDRINVPERVGAVELSVQASIGVGVFPSHGSDLDGLLFAANAALFRAKGAGGGTCARFTTALARRADLRTRLEERLLRAADSRDFRLFYQPLVSLPSGRLVGAEALLRWNDPELGSVGPAEFIPIAEESGLIEGVGAWVLREACRQRQLWREVGLDLPPIAINVSGVQLRNPHFVDGVMAALDEFGGAAEELEIEITETGLLDCGPQSRASLQRLQDAGVRTALDDFGVGYSSLAHLRDLPMYRLKIDRSFTVDCMRDARTLSIVKSVIDMAHALGLTVTAEGIETPEQQDWMFRLGCDSAQGYHFSRPLPPEDFLQRFLDSRALGAADGAGGPS